MTRAQVLTHVGGVAALVGVICCVTPLLPVAAGAVGATALLHYIYTDSFLIPFVALAVAVCTWGIWLGRKTDD